MRKIEKRGIFCLILAALLGIGLALFCFRFVVDGGDWASYPYNRHLYNNEGVLKGGTVLDRDGDVLYVWRDSDWDAVPEDFRAVGTGLFNMADGSVLTTEGFDSAVVQAVSY